MALNKLSAAKCNKTTKPGYLNDGGGLYLKITKTGNKAWVFRWRDRFETYETGKSAGVGKLREKGLGPFSPHDITLEKARALAGECRQMVRDRKDPIEEGQKDREEARERRQQAEIAKARNVTFGWCASQYIKAHAAGWKNKKHAAQWHSTIRTYAAPLMELPVADIKTPEVLFCLKPIWETKTETASRLRGRIESVLGWATVSGYRTGDNPAAWKHHLATVLPKPGSVRLVEHFDALDYARMGEFMAKLQQDDRLQARALEFLILTAARPGLVASTPGSRGARWDEINLEAKTWTLSAERMKANKEQVIPLSPQAVKLLKALPRASDCVFPGRSLDKSISSAAMLNIAKDLSQEMGLKTTAHGLRSSFRDWAGETTAHPREVIEMALAHQLKDKAEAAYARGNLLEKRRRLMKDWANYCDLEPGHAASVTPIRKKVTT